MTPELLKLSKDDIQTLRDAQIDLAAMHSTFDKLYRTNSASIQLMLDNFKALVDRLEEEATAKLLNAD